MVDNQIITPYNVTNSNTKLTRHPVISSYRYRTWYMRQRQEFYSL